MNDPETILIAKQNTRQLMRALGKIPPREEKVIRERFGLDGERKTLKQLADEYGCCRERIRQLEKIGLRRLQKVLSEQKPKEINRRPYTPPKKRRWFAPADPMTWLDPEAIKEQEDHPYHPPRPYIVMAFTTQDGRVVPSREFFATEEQAIGAIARNAGYPIIFCSFAFCVKDGWRFVTKYGSLPEDYAETTYIYPSIRYWK